LLSTHNIVKKYRLNLSVVTRALVVSGKDMLLGEDVIVIGNYAYIIDTNKLIKEIIEKTKGVHIFSKILERNTRDKGGIISTLIRDYNIDIRRVSSREIYVADRRATNYKIVKSNTVINNRYAIPGTELKGVIRTALLYWLVKENINGLRDEISKRIDELGQNLIDPKNAGWKIESLIKYILKIPKQARNREVTHYYDVMKNLQISDPLDINEKTVLDTLVVAKRRDPLNMIKSITPVICLSQGAEMLYELNIYKEPPVPTPIHGDIRKLYMETIPYVFKALKEYSLALIDYEKNLLAQYQSIATKDFVEKLESWRSAVSSNSNVFYIKIGFGANMYSKTIYLALPVDLREKLENAMTNIVKARSRGKITVWDHRTLKLVGSDHLRGKITPFAWSKIILTPWE